MQDRVREQYQMFWHLFFYQRERDSLVEICRFCSYRWADYWFTNLIYNYQKISRSFQGHKKSLESVKSFGIQNHRDWNFLEQISVHNGHSSAFSIIMTPVRRYRSALIYFVYQITIIVSNAIIVLKKKLQILLLYIAFLTCEYKFLLLYASLHFFYFKVMLYLHIFNALKIHKYHPVTSLANVKQSFLFFPLLHIS